MQISEIEKNILKFVVVMYSEKNIIINQRIINKKFIM